MHCECDFDVAAAINQVIDVATVHDCTYVVQEFQFRFYKNNYIPKN